MTSWGDPPEVLLALLDGVRPESLVLTSVGAPRGSAGDVRSYLSDGRGVGWDPPSTASRWQAALDAERLDQRVPPALRRLAGRGRGLDPTALPPEVLWQQWTRAEVLAKLLDVPILTWIGRHGLTLPERLPTPLPVAVCTLRVEDVVVSLGLAVLDGQQVT